jgi:hypothetical protein
VAPRRHGTPPRAHARMASNEGFGKIVLRV